MYYQGQYRARQGVKSLNTRIKKMSWQLMAVLVIILLLMLFKYTSGSMTGSASASIKDVFYKDYTEEAKSTIGQVIPKVTDYFKEKEGKEDETPSETTEFMFDSLPVSGKITSQFGERTHPTTGKEEIHSGIDIDAKESTEVKAVFDGVVEDLTEDKSLGLMLVINHGNGYKTRYGHLSKINVEKGKNIKKGDIIALTGNTGVTTGPHLHFEVESEGKTVNPLEFVKKKTE